MDKHLFQLLQLGQSLWLRASLFALAAAAAALAALALGPVAPAAVVGWVDREAGDELLKVLASSMLAVTTFSLATVVAAYGSVTSNASPRAAALLLDARSAHNALSSFIGAFIFGVVGLIALHTQAYDEAAAFVLFVETLLVLALVVVRLLAWIGQLSHLGRVGAAIELVEDEIRQALTDREPFLGGRPGGDPPAGALPVTAGEVGYVQHVDVPRLARIAEREGMTIHLAVLPGAFLRLSREVMHLEGLDAPPSDDLREELLEAMVVGRERTFRQDPRYGLAVLSEVASRALSPGVNDPGTAIAVVGAACRVLSLWAERHWEEAPDPRHPHVTVPGLSAADCFEDVFSPIERDGAGIVEVGVALQKTYADLACSTATGFADAARRHSRRALERALAALPFEDDRAELERLAQAVAAQPSCAQAPR